MRPTSPPKVSRTRPLDPPSVLTGPLLRRVVPLSTVSRGSSPRLSPASASPTRVGSRPSKTTDNTCPESYSIRRKGTTFVLCYLTTRRHPMKPFTFLVTARLSGCPSFSSHRTSGHPGSRTHRRRPATKARPRVARCTCGRLGPSLSNSGSQSVVRVQWKGASPASGLVLRHLPRPPRPPKHPTGNLPGGSLVGLAPALVRPDPHPGGGSTCSSRQKSVGG